MILPPVGTEFGAFTVPANSPVLGLVVPLLVAGVPPVVAKVIALATGVPLSITLAVKLVVPSTSKVVAGAMEKLISGLGEIVMVVKALQVVVSLIQACTLIVPATAGAVSWVVASPRLVVVSVGLNVPPLVVKAMSFSMAGGLPLSVTVAINSAVLPASKVVGLALSSVTARPAEGMFVGVFVAPLGLGVFVGVFVGVAGGKTEIARRSML